MLFNTEKLSGLPRKIKQLARREAEVSMVQQVMQGCSHKVVAFSTSQDCGNPVGLVHVLALPTTAQVPLLC